jgi:hypothetical protein
MTDNSDRMADHNEWPVFSTIWDDTAPSPVDMSHLLPKPAGGEGFIRNVDGHFVTEAGTRWRMWGVNMCTDMPLPPHDKAPAVARRLAKQGINTVRLHAIDHRWPNGIVERSERGSPENRWWGGQDEDTRSLDPEALARLDWFVVCCKREGIYMDLNLNVARTFSQADGVAAAEEIRWGKGLTYLDPRLIELQKEYAAQILGHANPFTGVRYADEPAVCLIELVNENSLLENFFRGLLTSPPGQDQHGNWRGAPAYYQEQLDRRWNDWLARRYPDREALATAWEGDLDEGEDATAGTVRRLPRDEWAEAAAPRFRDEARFVYEIERDYFQDMQTYLRGELGARQLILGTSDHNHGWSAMPMLAANAELDVMDGHFYWQHPVSHTPGRHWTREDWWIANTPMVDDPDGSVVPACSRSMVANKPYIVSEVNEPFPNDHAAEFIPIIAAYGLLQDWDGIVLYDYDGSWGRPYWQGEEWREQPDTYVFSIARDPVKWPQMAAGALMFLRGDVQAAREVVQRRMPIEWVLDSLREESDAEHPYWIEGVPGRLALVHRTEIASFDAEKLAPREVELPGNLIVSDTDELTWERQPHDGRVFIDTPRHQAIIGRAGQRATTNLQFDLEAPFAAVELASLDDLPLTRSRRMLLLTAGRVANTDMTWESEERRSLGANWGHAPTRIEPVTGTLTLRGIADAGIVWLQPLDERGQPIGEAMAMAGGDGTFRAQLDGDPATVWYLITVKR